MEKGNITINDLDRTTIAGLATSGLPILLPWSSSIAAVTPGTTFLSRLHATDDPWSKSNPFAELDETRVVYTNNDGGQATYNSTKTTSSASRSEHFSVSLGVSVGCKFLNASVTGAYDKDVLENNDANKSSIRATFRNGTVMFERPPPLNDDPIISLKFGGGLEAFQSRYGDYYVAGYRLGADTALMLSEGASTSSTVERFSVKVEVTVLWYEDSHTEEKFFTESSANSTFRLSAFDTLSDLYVSETRIGSEGLDSLRKTASGLSSVANQLSNRASAKMDELNLRTGRSLGFETSGFHRSTDGPRPSVIEEVAKAYGVPVLLIITPEDLIEAPKGIGKEDDLRRLEKYKVRYRANN